MEEWIVILLILSTVLACWSFSLLLRLVSEFVARKRKRLRAEHRRKGVVMALVAMWLGLVGSVSAGWFAVRIANQTNTDEVGDPEIVVAIAAGLVLFALLLLVWAIIGDRSRGRLRCPRCWFDMEGIETPLCPECGKAIRSERHLRKARRMKWPFALASVLIGFAVYGFVHLERVEETDSFALMPTWVLMLGWDVLPEDWILSENSTLGPTLERRLREKYVVGVNERRRERFLERLAKGLEGDIFDRWNPRRVLLLDGFIGPSDNNYWHILDDVELGELLLRSAEDMYYAVEHSDLYSDDPRIQRVVDCPEKEWPFRVAIAAATKPDINKDLEALLEELKKDDRLDAFQELEEVRQRRYSEYRHKHLTTLRSRVNLDLIYDSAFSDEVDSRTAYQLIIALDLWSEAFELFMLRDQDLSQSTSWYTAFNIVLNLMDVLEDDELADMYGQLDSLARHEELHNVAFGLSILNIMSRSNHDNSQSQNHVKLRKSTINRVPEALFFDDRDYSFFDDRDAKLSLLALQVRTQETPGNMVHWDSVNDYLRWAGEGPIVNWYQHHDTDIVAEEWTSMFRWCFEHPDPKIRAWAYDMIPVNENSCLDMRDERVLLLAQGLVDPDEDVRFEAKYTAEMFEHPTLLQLLESWYALKD